MSKPDDNRDPKTYKRKSSKVNQKDLQLARLARAGDLHAREELIVNHLPLVEKLLIPFMGKGVPTEVLYQEGCYGLILAVDRFDPDRKVQLEVYASYYVNKYLHRALAENLPQPIVLKSKSAKYAKLVRSALESLTTTNGSQPSVQELADCTGLSYSAVLSLLSSTQPIIPLDAADYADWLCVDANGRAVEDEVIQNLNELCLDAFPARLTKREEKILTLYFGFSPATQPHSFIQIAEQLGISADTVSSDYHKAIQKLKDAAQVR